MLGFNGGLLGKERRLTSGALAATGLWLPNEQSVAKRAGNWPFGPTEIPNIGDAFLGGFFAGYISHTANGVPTHALIVAPRATGASGTGYPLTTMRQVKTSNTATLNTQSDFDGSANTAAMVAAGISLHPIAQWCVGLSIGGYSDWYFPARDELDIAYFNLKPSTANNNISWGLNNYSVPKRTTNYTLGFPPQTSVTAFKQGGSEAFEATDHFSSTEVSTATSRSWVNQFSDGRENNGLGKTNYFRHRAFRRVPV